MVHEDSTALEQKDEPDRSAVPVPRASPPAAETETNKPSEGLIEAAKSRSGHVGDGSGSKEEQGTSSEGGRREPIGSGIWSSWRQSGPGSGGDGHQRDSGPLSGYQPAGRGSRTMKILKPGKPATSTSARTGPTYEPAPSSRSSGEYARRKSHASSSASGENSAPNSAGAAANPSRWDGKRTLSHADTAASPSVAVGAEKAQLPLRETRNLSQPLQAQQGSSALPRSANPVGSASAFSWMAPIAKPKTTGTTAE
jgi:hypothetical protein